MTKFHQNKHIFYKSVAQHRPLGKLIATKIASVYMNHLWDWLGSCLKVDGCVLIDFINTFLRRIHDI